jgi:hypothetical protein
MSHHHAQQYRSAHPAGHHGRTNAKFDEQGGTRAQGSIGSRRVHHAKRVLLVLYPGEELKTEAPDETGKIRHLKDAAQTYHGHIYVVGGKDEAYEAVGGFPPGKTHKDLGGGGHYEGITPPGWFTLGPAEHHTTLSWPMSVIPWGAKLRIGTDKELEYLVGTTWKKATGPHGEWTRAQSRWHQRDGESPKVSEEEREGFLATVVDDKGNLRYNEWIFNDFGKWSWNLMRGGKRTGYYIHTTPGDEQFRAGLKKYFPLLLGQSHGCVHLDPKDRDEMMAKGYLRAGIPVRIMPYGKQGPPK